MIETLDKGPNWALEAERLGAELKRAVRPVLTRGSLQHIERKWPLYWPEERWKRPQKELRLASATIILALSASNSVVGQDGPGAWSVSISDENGEVQEITLSDKGGASIPILVENNGITSITVSLDCTSPFDAQVSCPGDVTVTAGENTTVYGVISDVDVLNYAANNAWVTGTVIDRGPHCPSRGDCFGRCSVGDTGGFNLESIDDPVGPMNAGVDTILRVLSRTMGTSRIGFPKPMCPWIAH